MEGNRILVAATPATRRRLARALAGCELTFVERETEVRDALREGKFDMAVLGMHFAESKMLGILREALARPPAVTVVCVRGTPFDVLSEDTMAGFRQACLALGAQAVIDLLEFPEDPRGDAAVHDRLLGLLPSRA